MRLDLQEPPRIFWPSRYRGGFSNSETELWKTLLALRAAQALIQETGVEIAVALDELQDHLAAAVDRRYRVVGIRTTGERRAFQTLTEAETWLADR